MIELTIFNYLNKVMSVPVLIQRDDKLDTYIYFEKINNNGKFIHKCTIAIQSYAKTYEKTLLLNEEVKEKMLKIIELDNISNCKLVNDYVFNDLVRKRHRYQALFEISYY